jgi:Ras GTPase-activating-like protein IQGAP2/3
MQPLNSWIDKHKPIVAHYFNSLVEVDEPEDHLEVTKYNELTQKTKPVVLISIHEIFATHKLLVENLDQLAPEESDELRVILKDLGDVPPEIEPDSPHNREIQLTLINRFKVDVEDADEIERLYSETKELIIPVLRAIPIETSIHRLHLTDVLESGIRHASDTKNKALFGQINQILENISKLEEAGKVSKSDRYQSFVHDIALEVANRNAIREQQKKEIARLKATLESLREHQKYVNEQISQYQEYLRNAREMHYQGSVPGKKKRRRKKKKKDDTMLAGPFKFSYKDLAKMGVIVDSEVPKHLRKKTQFVISSEEHGVFDIVAKVASVSVEKMQLELDDLLERHYNGTEFLELDNPQVTLDVNMTIYLINRNFMGTK